MWSEALESTIQANFLALQVIKACKYLPFCATEAVPLELSSFKVYWSNFNISIYSFLKGSLLGLVLSNPLSIIWSEAEFPWFSLLLGCLVFAAFPWRTQQVWPIFLQCSSQDFDFFYWDWDFGLLTTKAELSVVCILFRANMIFLSLSSLLTSENTSLTLERGLVPSIFPHTSSKSLLSPRRNLYIRSFSTIDL